MLIGLKEDIIAELQPLFEEAEEKGLWFFTPYQKKWFSPQELRHEHENNRFLLCAINWELRYPNERLEELKQQKNSIENEIRRFRKRMNESKQQQKAAVAR